MNIEVRYRPFRGGSLTIRASGANDIELSGHYFEGALEYARAVLPFIRHESIRASIVKHLQVLENAGLVTHEKQGREVLYSLEARRLAEARIFLDSVSGSWDRAIERLRTMVEK